MGFELTIVSLFGLLGLSGILVNDSIILVARLTERLGTGQRLGEAAAGASRDRLRAVLLTSLTTMGGLVPLLFETSRQAQFLLPMAITIVFGLAAATLLVLVPGSRHCRHRRRYRSALPRDLWASPQGDMRNRRSCRRNSAVQILTAQLHGEGPHGLCGLFHVAVPGGR